MKNYSALKKTSIVLTSTFIITFEALRHNFFEELMNPDTEQFVASGVFLIGAIIFTHYVFGLIEKIEKKRQQKEREVKAIFDNSIDGIFIFDNRLKLLDMNNGAIVMTGWSSEDAIGKQNIYSLFDIKENVDFNDESIFNNRIEESFLLRKSGERLPVSITFSKITNENQESEKIAAIIRDLSERKQMENVIKDLYQEASQKQKEAETQYRIAKKIASVRDLTTRKSQPILQSVATEINKLVEGDFTAFLLYDFSKKVFHLAGITKEEACETVMEFFSKVNQSDHKEMETAISFDITDEKKITFIPLVSEGAVNGYLSIAERNSKRNWSLHQTELIKSIVNILSISFENVLMYKKMKDIAMLEERERLAREMHDGLAQVISSVHFKGKVLEFLVQDQTKESGSLLAENISELNEIVNEAFQEVRQNLFNLRTSMSLDRSFILTISEYIEQFGNQNKLDVTFEVCERDCEFNIPGDAKLHVLRILQEALSNVRKHSFATTVKVTCSCENPDFYLVTVEDDGIGFTKEDNTKPTGHYGLVTMEERANLINGDFHIRTEQNEGTKISLTIPKKGESVDG